MLDGQGGDEVLAGYRTTHGYRLADLLAGGRLRPAACSEIGAFPEPARALPAAVLTPFLPQRARWTLRGRRGRGDLLVHPSLRAADVAAAAAGGRTHARPAPVAVPPDPVAARAARAAPLRGPELDGALARGPRPLPRPPPRRASRTDSTRAQLYERGTTKIVLRRALSDLLPPAVRARRDKLGFVTPEQRFFHGRLGDLAEEVFRSPELRERGLVDGDEALERLTRHRAGSPAGFELWRALSVELWARRYLG